MNPEMSVVLCTAGYDHTIRFWEALSGICSRTIPSPDSQVNRLCISPDKRYLAAAGHHLVKIYDVKSQNPQPIYTFDGHTNNVTGLAFHCDGKWLATSSEDGTVKIWDVRTSVVQRNYNHGSPVNDVVIHPNQGELISCDRAGTVRVWDLGENKCSHQLIPEEDVSVASVTIATDGSLLCAGNNMGRVFVWRMLQTDESTSLVPVCKFSAHGTYITRVLLSPDIRHLATCSADHTARIWAIEPGLGDPNFPGSNRAIAASSAPASREPSFRGTTTTAPRAPARQGASDSESDSDVESDSDDSGPSPGRPTTNGKGKGPTASESSPNARKKAGEQEKDEDEDEDEDDEDDADGDQPLQLEMTLQGHQRWVWDCAFSADSAYLVTACSDHYARLWELSSQNIIRQYNGHHRGAVCVALNDTANP